MTAKDTIGAMVAGLADGSIKVVDLTATLTPEYPIIELPPEFNQAAPFKQTELSRYDDRGPAWYWNDFTLNEHTGTHFDAPIHWISGKDLPNNAVDTIDPADFIAPACVVDVSAEVAADQDFILTRAHLEAWEADNGRIPPDPGCSCAPTGRKSLRRTTSRTCAKTAPTTPGRTPTA